VGEREASEGLGETARRRSRRVGLAGLSNPLLMSLLKQLETCMADIENLVEVYTYSSRSASEELPEPAESVWEKAATEYVAYFGATEPLVLATLERRVELLRSVKPMGKIDGTLNKGIVKLLSYVCDYLRVKELKKN
jgi:hypothetical protein